MVEADISGTSICPWPAIRMAIPPSPNHMKTTKHNSCGAILRRFKTAGALFAIAAVFPLTACNPSASTYSVPTSAFMAPPKGTLSVGDVIRLTFPGAVELNQSVKIQPDGKIGLPMVGGVSAAGQSPGGLQSTLTG